MGDGQVSLGDMVVKPNATKVRKLGSGNVLAGFAGSTADALTLVERLETKLEEHEGGWHQGYRSNTTTCKVDLTLFSLYGYEKGARCLWLLWCIG